MRRKDRELSRESAVSIVDRCEYAVLSMIDGELPYATPVSIVRIGEYLYFHCAIKGRRTNALRLSSRVCMTCVGETSVPKGEFTTKYESAIVFGRAFEVEEDSEKIEALRQLCLRHTPENMENFENELKKSFLHTSIWKVLICELTGKSNGKETKENSL